MITQIKQLTQRKASFSITRDGYERNYERQYLVQTDNNDDNEVTVEEQLLSQSGVGLGSAFVSDYGARIDTIEVSDVDGDPKLWLADVKFASVNGEDADPLENQKDPLIREPRISVRFEKKQVPLEGNFDSDAGSGAGKISQTLGCINSAGQRFNPPPVFTKTVPIISLINDEGTLDLVELCLYQDKINNAAFAGFPARTLMINITNIQERFENNERLWRKTYELAFNEQTWDLFILDHGTIDDGNGVFREVLLDGSGNVTTDPHYLKFEPYAAINFNFNPISVLADIN